MVAVYSFVIEEVRWQMAEGRRLIGWRSTKPIVDTAEGRS
jgi:hypothetical protein